MEEVKPYGNKPSAERAAFMQALIGYEVRLTDGTSAKIALIHPHNKTRPLVQAEERFIDLSKDYSLQIEQVYAGNEETEMTTPF